MGFWRIGKIQRQRYRDTRMKMMLEFSWFLGITAEDIHMYFLRRLNLTFRELSERQVGTRRRTNLRELVTISEKNDRPS